MSAVADVVCASLCRIDICGPNGRFTLAVPVDIAIADLLPSLVGFAGDGLDEDGVEHGGWVLQRLGEDPLPDGATLGSAGIRDGEMLHLRPAQEAMPPVHFDDLVDAVATTLRGRSDSWRPDHARFWLIALSGIACVVSLLLLGGPGPVAPRMGLAASSTVLLLMAATLVSRVGDDNIAGTVLGTAAAAFLGYGVFLVAGDGAGRPVQGAGLLAGATTVAAASAVALLAVRSPVFLGLIVASMVAAVGALAVLFGAPEAGAAALVLALLAFGGGLIPALAFRFSRLRLPHLPSDAEQLQEGIAPVPSRSVLASSAIADGYMTALFVCNGLLAASCLTVLTRSRDFGAVGVCVVTSLLLMLHARGLGATWHRLSALLPGGYGLATLLYQLGMAARPPDRLVEAFGVVVLAAALVGAARTLPGRRMLPHWGRAADIVHTMLAVALIPLVLVVLGVFQV